MKKSLFKEAQNQFSLISSKFKFINKVKVYLGSSNLKLNKYNEAIHLYNEVLKNNDFKNNIIDKNIIYNDLALCYILLKNNKKAEFYFKKGYVNQKDTLKLIDNYNNIANIYYNQYKDGIAILYFDKAYLLAKKLKTKKNRNSPQELFKINKKNLY